MHCEVGAVIIFCGSGKRRPLKAGRLGKSRKFLSNLIPMLASDSASHDGAPWSQAGEQGQGLFAKGRQGSLTGNQKEL